MAETAQEEEEEEEAPEEEAPVEPLFAPPPRAPSVLHATTHGTMTLTPVPAPELIVLVSMTVLENVLLNTL